MTISIVTRTPVAPLTVFEQQQPDGLAGFQFGPNPVGCWVDADEAQRLIDYMQGQLPAMLAANRRHQEQSSGNANDGTMTTEALQSDKVSAGHAS